MNKDKAVSFLHLIVSGEIREAYRTYISSNFRHHNPYFKGDAESLMLAMEENDVDSPHKILEVKHVLEDGDIVAVHSHIKQNEEDLGAAVVHLFRFDNELIVEMWDVGQPIPEESPRTEGCATLDGCCCCIAAFEYKTNVVSFF